MARARSERSERVVLYLPMGEVHNFARLVDRVQDRFPNVVVRASTGEHEPSLLDERSGRLFVGAPAVEGVSTASD